MTDFADRPLDLADQGVLDRLAAVHGAVDPPPADLDDRVLFAISLGDLDAEMARLGRDVLVGSGARGGERVRTITFEADSRTVMLTMSPRGDGAVRIDGWLAPPARLRVDLRFPAPTPPRTVTSDDAGRFVFDDVPRGLVQVLIRPPDAGAGDAASVATPCFAL